MYFVISVTIISLILMFVCILKFPAIRIKDHSYDTFYLPVLLGALILIIFPTFDKTNYFKVLSSNTAMNPLKILVLFICVSIISIALDETGFFNVVATKFIKRFKASQFLLFYSMFVLIGILTVFTSNDIVILTFTPFILAFSKKGKINPLPYLVMEFVVANTFSMALEIGNPTNIYLASIFEIPFFDYFTKMIIPTVFCGIGAVLIITLLFYKDLKKPIDTFDIEDVELKNKPLCIVSLIHLILTTILLAISSYIGLEMWIICLGFATSLILIYLIYSIKTKRYYYVKSTLRRAPYTLIPFVLSMFTLIMALDSYGVFNTIANGLNAITNPYLQSVAYLGSSSLACNILNNIPMTLAYGSILQNCTNINNIYATIIGSNLGAILTPVGALAGIMWIRILKINEIDYSFKAFMKNGAIIISVMLLFAALALLII